MKTYKELKQELENRNDLQESRLLRKGVALSFAAKARSESQKIERELSNAKHTLQHKAGDTLEDQVRSLKEGLIEICNANIALRKQLGAMTAIIVSGQLFHERTDMRIFTLLRR